VVFDRWGEVEIDGEMMHDAPRNAFANLTDDEKAELRYLTTGAAYVQQARNQLVTFGHSKGWQGETMNEVLALLRAEVIVGDS
jgi:hypothetical protein